jgi:hypothetical protein
MFVHQHAYLHRITYCTCVGMPVFWCCLNAKAHVFQAKREVIASERLRVRHKYGIPPDSFVYACFNRALKINAATFR